MLVKIPSAGLKLTDVAPLKFVPFRVRTTVVSCRPEMGDIDFRVGAFGGMTVKRSDPLVPFEVVTVTLYCPGTALESMIKCAVTCVAVELMSLVLMPLGGVKFIDAPDKFVPLIVRLTVVPCCPELGTSGGVIWGAEGLEGTSIAKRRPPTYIYSFEG
jgi:hypothetical protein